RPPEHPGQGDRADPHPGRGAARDDPGVARPPGRPASGQPIADTRSTAAAPAHARRAQAPPPARKPGAAAAAGLRGSALDRYRDPGPPRQPGREPADGPASAAGQLPAGVPAWLGEQDILPPAP